jgi:uncharacterized protein YggE
MLMRLIIPALAALLLVGVPVSPAAAEEDLRSTVAVVGDGRVLVQPDVATVSFGVESTGPSVSAAQDDAATRMQAVIDTLLGQGVAREDIRTTRLGVTPIYDQRDNSILRGYRVVNSVQAKLRDLGAVGQVVDAATAAGANRVEGISFEVEDLSGYKDQARALAMGNARAKADQLAGLAGVRIVGVKAIIESDAAATPVRAVRSDVQAAPAAAPPVEPGQQEVRTQVSVTFIVE